MSPDNPRIEKLKVQREQLTARVQKLEASEKQRERNAIPTVKFSPAHIAQIKPRKMRRWMSLSVI